jgi:ABC-type uncharacterized transport system substrate-binding protein
MKFSVSFRRVTSPELRFEVVSAALTEHSASVPKRLENVRAFEGLRGLGMLAIEKRLNDSSGYWLEAGKGGYSIYEGASKCFPWLKKVMLGTSYEEKSKAEFDAAVDACLETDNSDGACLKFSAADVVIWLDNQLVTDPDTLLHIASALGVSATKPSLLPIAAVSSEDAKTKPFLNVALLGVANMTYIQSIRDGVKEVLSSKFQMPEGALLLGNSPGPDTQVLTKGRKLTKQWRNYIESQLKNCDPEAEIYLISVGTSASVALRAYLDEKPKRDVRVVFAGVTYPVTSYLVDSLRNRREQRDITGVAYGGDGLRAIAALIHNYLFADLPITFVYFNDVMLDKQSAEQLQRTRLVEEKLLKLVPADVASFPRAVAQKNKIYFSWLSFEMIFDSSDGKYAELKQYLSKRKVIAATARNCRQGTLASVGADDEAIGRAAAGRIVDRVTGADTRHFGEVDVLPTTLQYCINMDVARELKMEDSFKRCVLKGARWVFADGEDYSGNDYVDKFLPIAADADFSDDAQPTVS